MVCFTKQPHIYLKTRTQLKPVQSTDAELNMSNTSDSKQPMYGFKTLIEIKFLLTMYTVKEF